MNQESQVLPLIPGYHIVISIWLGGCSGPFLGRFFNNLGLRAKWFCRFVLRFSGLSCGFFIPERIITLSKIDKLSENILKEATYDKKGYIILTAGGLLEVQKGLSPVWPQTASGPFNIFLTALGISASVS